MNTPHTVNFLQRVFSSKVNQIFPLDVVKIINNDRIEMENKMYNKKYNIIKMYNKYYKELYYIKYKYYSYELKFDDFARILNEEYNNKLLSNNNRKNYEPVFNNLNDELIIYYLELITEKNEEEEYDVPGEFIYSVIKFFSNVLEQNKKYNKILLMYEEDKNQ